MPDHLPPTLKGDRRYKKALAVPDHLPPTLRERQVGTRVLARSQPKPRYESATTHAAAVRTHDTENSPHCEALMVPPNTSGGHTSSVNNSVCHAESLAAGRAEIPAITAVPPRGTCCR